MVTSATTWASRRSGDTPISADSDPLIPPQPGARLTSTAVKGFAWQVASFGGNRLVVFVSTLALARLLDPTDFGVFAAALTFTQYLEVLLDFGVGSFLIYDQEDAITDRVHVAFTLNLIVTVVLTALAVALSPVIANLFGAPRQSLLFAVMSLYLVLRGLSQVNEALIQRDLLFKRLVIVDLLGAVVRAGLSVALAATGSGAWAIVIGFLAGQAVTTVGNYFVSRYRPRIRFNRAISRKMLSFGLNSVAIDVLTELSLDGDYLVIGAVLGATALGFYTVAYRLPELIINNLFWMFSGVAFPIFSRSRMMGMEVLRRAMLKALKFTTLFGLSAGVGLAIVARDAIIVLFGAKWHSAINPMIIISLAAALAAAPYASGSLFPALGKPGTLVWMNVPLTIFRLGGFLLVAQYGILWVAVVHLVTNAVSLPIRLAVANRVVGTTAAQTLRALAPAVAAALGVAAFALPLRFLIPTGPVSLVAIVVAGILGAVAGLALVDRGIFAEMRRLGRSLASTA